MSTSDNGKGRSIEGSRSRRIVKVATVRNPDERVAKQTSSWTIPLQSGIDSSECYGRDEEAATHLLLNNTKENKRQSNAGDLPRHLINSGHCFNQESQLYDVILGEKEVDDTAMTENAEPCVTLSPSSNGNLSNQHECVTKSRVDPENCGSDGDGDGDATCDNNAVESSRKEVKRKYCKAAIMIAVVWSIMVVLVSITLGVDWWGVNERLDRKDDVDLCTLCGNGLEFVLNKTSFTDWPTRQPSPSNVHGMGTSRPPPENFAEICAPSKLLDHGPHYKGPSSGELMASCIETCLSGEHHRYKICSTLREFVLLPGLNL